MKSFQPSIATIAHVKNIVEIEELCFTTDRLSHRQVKHFINSPTALVTVATDANKIIGTGIVLFRKNSKIARLYSIAVMPSYQEFGVARTLYSFIEKYIREHRYTEIRLEVRKDNVRAINFYEKNAYAIFGEYKHFYEDGADALRMKKNLRH